MNRAARQGLAGVLVMVIAGCRSPASTGTTPNASTATPAPRPTPPIPPGAPAIDACTVDTDCTIAVSAPSDLCCDYTVTAMPISVKYLAFVETARKTSCGGVTCPPGALPGARLAACGYEPHCKSGKCDNGCTPVLSPTGKPMSLGGGIPGACVNCPPSGCPKMCDPYFKP